MTEQTCPCGAPTAGTTLCGRCTKTLDIAVANVRAYVADLDTIRTRQARYGTRSGKTSRGAEVPLPVDLRFTDTHPDPNSAAGTGSMLEADARNTLVGWTRIALEEAPARLIGPTCRAACLHVSCSLVHRGRPPADNLVSCCHYLTRNLRRLAAAQWAPEMLDELLDLERRLRRFVDRPADRWYAGPCTAGLEGWEGAWFCGAELYATPGQEFLRCPDCRLSYTVADRRAWLLASAEDRWETASTIARAVTVWTDYDRGETRLVRRISDWAGRDRIKVRGYRTVDGRPRPVYRIGDVLDLLVDDARNAEARPA